MKIPDGRTIGFRSKKAAQIAGHFARVNGDEIEKLKLIKLMYLSERESIQQRGRPIFYDEFYSLQHGPICSNALNAINGDLDKNTWDAYIQRDGNKDVRPGKSSDVSELSRSDIVILDTVWKAFGWMSAGQIRNWTHKHCPEYVEVSEGRLPISYVDLFRVLGYENPDEMAEHIRDYRSMEAATAAQ